MANIQDNLFDASEILDGILDWVAIESPSHSRDGVNQMVDEVERHLDALGAVISRQSPSPACGDILTARLFDTNRDEPGILILGHVDTVHMLGTLDEELPIRREGDKVYGPGILDMKGGLYLAIHALRTLQRSERWPRLPITVMVIPDEEIGSPYSRRHIEEEARKHRYVLVPEPARGGGVVTGRHAFLRYQIDVHGRAAHAGADNRRGLSAISAMGRLTEWLESQSDYESGQTYAVGIIEGGTFVNVVPRHCRAEVLCVAPDVAAIEQAQRTMASLESYFSADEGLDVQITEGPIRPLFPPHVHTMQLYERARSIAREFGSVLEHGQYGGGSDGNFTGALGIATLDGLGVVGHGPHTLEEHLLYSELVPRCRLLAGLIETLD
jgi:glutamate carboxypeptidase